MSPIHFELSDDSAKHAHHRAMKESQASGETHFNLLIVSESFRNLQLIERHRLVNDLLAEEMNSDAGGTVHALSIKAKTPE